MDDPFNIIDSMYDYLTNTSKRYYHCNINFDDNAINYIITKKYYNSYPFINNFRHNRNRDIIIKIYDKISDKEDKIVFAINHTIKDPEMNIDDLIFISIIKHLNIKYLFMDYELLFNNANTTNIMYFINKYFNYKMIYYCDTENLFNCFINAKKNKTINYCKKLMLFLNNLSIIKKQLYISKCTKNELQNILKSKYISKSLKQIVENEYNRLY